MPMNYGTVQRRPDCEGLHGRAWRIPMAAPGQRGRPDADATVDGWLLHAPGAHPFWVYWVLAVIHLRPLAGVKPAYVRLSGATHEIIIMALNPETQLPEIEDVGRGEATFDFLTPIDVMEQFVVRDDAEAAQLCELAIRCCVDGMASPDQDWRSWWSRAIAETAMHLREGRHPEART
jgi:hypothetical protein